MPKFNFLRSTDSTNKRLEDIPVERIRPNPNQPRTSFDDESILELAQSISQVGLIQPLTVRRAGADFELVAGERRLRAVKSLGWLRVACIVQEEVVEEASATMALIENLQREDLHYLEEAACYAALIQRYSLTQEELAQRLGKSQSSIANKLRILRLSPAVQQAMQEAGFTERHARALLKLKGEQEQLDAVKRVAEKNLSVKETEALVEKTLNRLYDDRVDGARPRPKMVRLVKDYRLFMNTINSAVNQLRDADMVVEVEQLDIPDGVDIHIIVKRPS